MLQSAAVAVSLQHIFGSSCRTSCAWRLWETCLSWPLGPCMNSRKCHNHTSTFPDPAAEPCSPHPREEDGTAPVKVCKSTLLQEKQETLTCPACNHPPACSSSASLQPLSSSAGLQQHLRAWAGPPQQHHVKDAAQARRRVSACALPCPAPLVTLHDGRRSWPSSKPP